MRRILAGMAFVLAARLLAAQEAEPPVFPAGTEAVLLDMVVRDDEGRLVPDLRADEVQVFEDDQWCRISSFRLVRPVDPGGTGPNVAGPGTSASGPPGRSPGAPRGPREGPQPPAEGSRSASVEDESLRQESENRAERMGSVVLLVFDSLGLEAARRARQAALEMVSRPFPDNTWFAVLKVGREFSVLRPFTEDRSSLAGPIERATTGAEGGQTDSQGSGGEGAAEEALALALEVVEAEARGAGPGELAMAQASASLAEFESRMGTLRRGEATLYPLVAVARSLRTVRGRKTLLYFGPGLEVPPDLYEVFQSAISEANRSNLAVYGFDARGLEVHGYAASAPSVFRGSASPWNLARGASDPIAAIVANPQQNLLNLSEGTGGALVANTNDLRPSLERVTEDLRAYYEIAYGTPSPVADGTWREIEVKVSRPGVRVRARKGYFALPPGAPVVRPSELPLMFALDRGTLPRNVPLRAAAVHLAGGGEERDVLVVLKVPLSAATFESVVGERGEHGERARLSLLARVRDDDGGLVARMSHETPLEGSESEVAAIRAQTLVVERALQLAPGHYTLEAAVLDRASSEIGARRVEFEVPAQTGLSLGSLTVVRPEPLAEGADDLLRAGDVRGTPRLGEPVVATEGEVVGVFLSLHPGDAPEPPQLILEISRDSQIVSRRDVDLPPPAASGRIAYLGQLSAQDFAPGRYVVHATARQGTEEAIAVTSFRVVASGADVPSVAARRADADQSLAGYLTLVERYRAGSHEETVEELRSWNEDRTWRAVGQLLAPWSQGRQESRRFADPFVGVVETARTLQAAALLHTDVALTAFSDGRTNDHALHVKCLRSLLRALHDWQRGEDQRGVSETISARDLYLAVAAAQLGIGAILQANVLVAEYSAGELGFPSPMSPRDGRLAEYSAEDFGMAPAAEPDRIIARHLRDVARDGDMLLLAGCAQEAMAILCRPSPEIEGQQAGQREHAALRRAERFYRYALDVVPESVEARLRLGWTLLKQDRVGSARAPLEAVAARGDPNQASLAWLFLGRLHEREDDPQPAIAAFRRAIALAPGAQAARVGLARALEREADFRVARDILEPFFVSWDAASPGRDPWVEYPFGPERLRLRPFEALLQWIRQP